VPDIIAKLCGIKPEVLGGTLRIEFVDKRGIDCGGPRREFFMMGGQQLSSPRYRR
jgi:hypothetical protein